MNRRSLELAVEQNHTDRNASYVALSGLEEAMEAPGPGREVAWLGTVIEGLDSFIVALEEQARHNRDPDMAAGKPATGAANGVSVE